MNKYVFKLTIIFSVFTLLVALTTVAFAAKKCPLDLENDPYPGKCGLYIDKDNDQICDLSQLDNNSSNVTDAQKSTPIPEKEPAQNTAQKEPAQNTQKEEPVQDIPQSQPSQQSTPVKQPALVTPESTSQAGAILKADSTPEPTKQGNVESTKNISEELNSDATKTQQDGTLDGVSDSTLNGASEDTPDGMIEDINTQNITDDQNQSIVNEAIEDGTSENNNTQDIERESFLSKYLENQFSTRNIITLILLVLGSLFIFMQYRWKHSKWLRYALLAFSLLYLGFITKGCPSPIGSIQQIPIFYSQMIQGKALDWLIVFIIPILFSIFFGRVYCGSVCPFGAVQEFIHKIGVLLKLNISVNKKTDKILKNFRYIVLIGLVVLAFLTSTAWFCRFDPFASIFNFKWNTVALISTIVLLISSFIVSRPFCRYFCPYGILLALISKVALVFKMKNLNTWCKNCVACEKICQVQAIEKGKIDESECIRCGECIEKCPILTKSKMNQDKNISSQMNIKTPAKID